MSLEEYILIWMHEDLITWGMHKKEAIWRGGTVAAHESDSKHIQTLRGEACSQRFSVTLCKQERSPQSYTNCSPEHSHVRQICVSVWSVAFIPASELNTAAGVHYSQSRKCSFESTWHFRLSHRNVVVVNGRRWHSHGASFWMILLDIYISVMKYSLEMGPAFVFDNSIQAWEPNKEQRSSEHKTR